jgi:hypothetical protein
MSSTDREFFPSGVCAERLSVVAKRNAVMVLKQRAMVISGGGVGAKSFP